MSDEARSMEDPTTRKDLPIAPFAVVLRRSRLVSVGPFAQGTAYVRVAAGQSITYSTSLTGVEGTPQYSLFISVEAP